MPTNIASATAFLYSGSNPIQTGVAAGTIEARRVAVLRGKVEDSSGAAIAGVTVTVLGHPELGQTLTRADGMFDLAVNGGGQLTVNYAKDGYLGYLPVQRSVNTPWQDYAWLPDVVMIPYDNAVTQVDLQATAMQVARGSAVTDSDGSRQATVLVPKGTTASLVLADGSTQPLTSMHLRATEYTVGATGPQAMPAPLPPSSGYTYAVEFSADEAISAGATSVQFSAALPVYVENFLGFPVGGAVPVGYYDRRKGQWIASNNGRVISVVSITNGLADLDLDGDGVVNAQADLTALGVTDEERANLAQLYKAGQSLWRVPIAHFTAWDCNWPYGPPDDAVPPPVPQPDPVIDDPDEECGSIIGCQDQTLGEVLPIAGTPFTLHFKSERTPGRVDAYSKNIPVIGATLPPSLRDIHVVVTVAGRSFEATLAPAPNQVFQFTWDGKDAYGRTVQGEQFAEVSVSFDYAPQYYAVKSDWSNSFARAEAAGATVSGSRGAAMIGLSRTWTELLGSWDARDAGLDGWTLSVNNMYDSLSKRLLLGDGTQRAAAAIRPIITTIAGNGDIYNTAGDGGPATAAGVGLPNSVAYGPDGSLYIADELHWQVRRVDPNRVISTFAGVKYSAATDYSYVGDGGPATAASLLPVSLAMGLDGSLFIADPQHNRVRRVDASGIISTYAGGSDAGCSEGGFGDGGPATAAGLCNPESIAIGPDGSLYIADQDVSRVRRVGTDGIITTIAGTVGANNRNFGLSGDGGPAIAAQLDEPVGVAVGADGSVYIADYYNKRIRRVGTDGIITTVAGGGSGGDGEQGTNAALSWVFAVAVGADGSLFINDNKSRIRRVGPDGIITTVAGSVQGASSVLEGEPATDAVINAEPGLAISCDGNLVLIEPGYVRRVGLPFPDSNGTNTYFPSDDGSEVYEFESTGRHLKTLDARTGTVRYQFAYDSNGYLASVTDADGNVTTVERNGAAATAIVAPHGQRTALSVDANGWLTIVTDPTGAAYTMDYTSRGLMQHLTDPLGHQHAFTFDSNGRLTKDADPAGGSTSLTRTDQSDGYTVATTSALGRTHSYEVQLLSTGAIQRTVTQTNGLVTVTTKGTDASEQTALPDGTTAIVDYGPDPRWGMLAPIATSTVVAMPSGLSRTVTASRSASLSDSTNLFSLTQLADKVSINGNAWTSVYDGTHQKLTLTSPLGRTVTLTLNAQDRVVEQDVPGLASTTFTHDRLGRLQAVARGARQSALAYDTQGYVDSVTDPLSRTATFQNDAIGRLLTLTNPDSSQVLFTYDANSNLTSLTPPGRSAYQFGYSSVDLQTTFTPPSVATWNPTTAYSYDVDKSVTQVQRPDGSIVSTQRDTAGRVSEVDYPQQQFVKFGYDAKSGYLASAQNSEEALAWTYDGSLVTSVSLTGTVNGTVSYAYNNDFRLTGTQVKGANAANLGYDKDGLLTTVGNLMLTRDSGNGMVKGTSAGVVTESLGYNTFGEVTSYTAAAGSTNLMSIQYLRDALGRITEEVETISGTATTYDYGYDAANRLVQVQINGATTASWSYDSNGNRTSETKGTAVTAATYDAQDRLQTYGTTSYTFGNAGDLQTRLRSGDTAPTKYLYDALGNLTAATLPNGTVIAYVVDAQGRRVGKLVNGTLVQAFLWESQLRIAAELDVSGNVVSRFMYGTKVNVPELMIKGGVTYRIITDQLGCPRLVVSSADGSIVQQITYDEWGNVLSDTNPGFQPFGFAGGLYDRDLELVRFGARDYDPEIGRWTRPEPLLSLPDGADAQALRGGDLNAYTYAQDDPVRYTDSGGFRPTLAELAAGGPPRPTLTATAYIELLVGTKEPYPLFDMSDIGVGDGYLIQLGEDGDIAAYYGILWYDDDYYSGQPVCTTGPTPRLNAHRRHYYDWLHSVDPNGLLKQLPDPGSIKAPTELTPTQVSVGPRG